MGYPQCDAEPSPASNTLAAQQRKPTLYPVLEVVEGKLTLSEGGRSREVTPHWNGEMLRVGCTTVTKEALDVLKEATR